MKPHRLYKSLSDGIVLRWSRRLDNRSPDPTLAVAPSLRLSEDHRRPSNDSPSRVAPYASYALNGDMHHDDAQDRGRLGSTTSVMLADRVYRVASMFGCLNKTADTDDAQPRVVLGSSVSVMLQDRGRLRQPHSRRYDSRLCSKGTMIARRCSAPTVLGEAGSYMLADRAILGQSHGRYPYIILQEGRCSSPSVAPTTGRNTLGRGGRLGQQHSRGAIKLRTLNLRKEDYACDRV